MGQPSVNKMLRKMTWKEFKEWLAYSELEPFDESRADFRMAHVVATLINLHRGKNKAAVTVEEIRLRFGDDIKKQDPKQQELIGKMFADLFNMFDDEKEQKRKSIDDRRQSRNPVRKATS